MIRLNLLPAEQKQQLHTQAVSRRWRSAAALVLVAGLIGNVALAATDWWLQQQSQTYADQIQTLQQSSQDSRLGEVNQLITRINQTLTPLATALPQARNWSKDLNDFLTSLPNSITISEISLSQTGDLSISGVAATRSDFLALDEQLKQHPMLTNVQTESLAGTREQLPFHYTARLIQPAE